MAAWLESDPEEDDDLADDDSDGDDDESDDDESDDDESDYSDDSDDGRAVDTSYDDGLVFVGLALRAETQTSSRIIKEVCKKEGLNPQQVDERHGSGEILKEIWDLIERAQFLVFDLTFERPNVYYEIGFAHGKGNLDNILLIAKQGTSIHFDVGARRVHQYADERSLRKILRENLRKMKKL